MKQCVLIALLFVTASVHAQQAPAALVVQNRTEQTLFVLVPGDQELSPQSTFRQVPAGGLLPVPATGRVSGVAYQRGSFTLSSFSFSATRVAELTRRSARRVYLPVENRHLVDRSDLSATSFEGIIGRPQIDNVYLEWVAREPALLRGRNRRPEAAYIDLGEGREAITLEESLLWERGGTDLEWVKGAGGDQDLFVAMASFSPFAAASSVFLYLLEPTGDVPVATLEFSPGRGGGFVFLWLPTEPDPVVVGNLVSSEFFLEAQLWQEEIESSLGRPLQQLSADIATASSAAGPWEEFALGGIELSSLFGP